MIEHNILGWVNSEMKQLTQRNETFIIHASKFNSLSLAFPNINRVLTRYIVHDFWKI